MKHHIFTFSTIGALFLSTSLVDAQMLTASSDWVVRKVSGENPYCTASRLYNDKIKFTIAKNKNNEGTIALDLGQRALETTQIYMVGLKGNAFSREYTVKPTNSNIIILRVGQDQGLFNGLKQSSSVSLSINSQKYDIDLSNYVGQQMNDCLGLPKTQIAVAPQTQNITSRTVKAPIPTLPTMDQSLKIDELLQENKRLIDMLSRENATKIQVSEVKEKEGVDRIALQKLQNNLAQSQKRNADLLSQMQQLEKDLLASRRSVNPDLTAALQQRDSQIATLIEQNTSLKNSLALLQSKQPEVKVVTKEVVKEIKVPTTSPKVMQENAKMKAQLSKLNDDMQVAMAERDSLKQQLKTKKTETIVKEVIKEVEVPVVKEIIKEIPVPMPSMNADGQGESSVAVMEQIAELDAESKSYKAERDEYRRLLQAERRRLREAGDVTSQIKETSNKENNLISDIRRLEKEKVELIRQLEFAKKTGDVVVSSKEPREPINVTGSEDLNALSIQLAEAKKALLKAEKDKEKLQKRMMIIDEESMRYQREFAQKAVSNLADDRPEVIQEEMEMKTLRAEIAALEAQNNILKEDIKVEKNNSIKAIDEENVTSTPVETANLVKGEERSDNLAQPHQRVSRPIDNMADIQSLRSRLQKSEKSEKPIPLANIVDEIQKTIIPSAPISPVVPQELTANKRPTNIMLSGDEIRQLVSLSKIPLQTSVDRVDRISGADFAAFRWDTGIVYGSGEQSRLSDISNFDNSVRDYIQKTADRCQGSFDQNIQTINGAGSMSVRSADIACVDDNAQGSAASILFFAHGGMFYALAHEADMDSFKIAMDMRDRLVGSVDTVF